MLKNRSIPFGYTVRDGRTIIAHSEADIIREIFDSYIHGTSMKDIADELTARRVPYSEKTVTWDKARVARILDNARYKGTDAYDPIIEECVFDEAAAAKTSRKCYIPEKNPEGIDVLLHRIRCAKCGKPMVRSTNLKRKVRKSWKCTNPECGCSIRISDQELMGKVMALMNKITVNNSLMMPKPKAARQESPGVIRIQNEIVNEMNRTDPSEEYIVEKLSEMAQVLYKQSASAQFLKSQRAWKKAQQMKPQKHFHRQDFLDMVQDLTLSETGILTIHTLADTDITEGEE